MKDINNFICYTVLPFQTLAVLEIYTFFKLICMLAHTAIYLRKDPSDTPCQEGQNPKSHISLSYDGAHSQKKFWE